MPVKISWNFCVKIIKDSFCNHFSNFFVVNMSNYATSRKVGLIDFVVSLALNIIMMVFEFFIAYILDITDFFLTRGFISNFFYLIQGKGNIA